MVVLKRNTRKDRRQWYRIPKDTVATTIPLRTEDMDHHTRRTTPMEVNSPSFDKQ
jgi:hypothetical protein